MKKILTATFLVLFLFILASCHKDIEESDFVPPQSDFLLETYFVPAETEIFNDFSAQLPNFNFKNPILENYNESFRFEFTVISDNFEFNAYVEALKTKGFNGGTEGAPISSNGYYKATNSDNYMVEAVLKDSTNLTVTVTRP